MTGAGQQQENHLRLSEAGPLQSLHSPVLLAEVMSGLAVTAEGRYLDGTYGRGGHAQAIVDSLGPLGKLWVMDQDPHAIAVAHQRLGHDRRVQIEHANFTTLMDYVDAESLDGVLFDLGVSSPQLDVAERGFSFAKEGPLDMRMNWTQGQSAQEWLALADQDEIADVLWQFGQERHSRRIARAIVAQRRHAPFTSTLQLAEVIANAQPPVRSKIHPATRSFQAIRIHINQELSALARGLEQAVQALRGGGRLAVISFHSLEDRIVKHYFRRLAKAPPNQRRMPSEPSQFQPSLAIKAKAIRPQQNELVANPRARSAVLRIAVKLPLLTGCR